MNYSRYTYCDFYFLNNAGQKSNGNNKLMCFIF